jgi:hypothetical protein
MDTLVIWGGLSNEHANGGITKCDLAPFVVFPIGYYFNGGHI